MSGLRGHGVGLSTLKRALVTKAALEECNVNPPPDLLYSADGSRILAYVKDGHITFVNDNISQYPYGEVKVIHGLIDFGAK